MAAAVAGVGIIIQRWNSRAPAAPNDAGIYPGSTRSMPAAPAPDANDANMAGQTPTPAEDPSPLVVFGDGTVNPEAP
jgi:hypothetical protein